MGGAAVRRLMDGAGAGGRGHRRAHRRDLHPRHALPRHRLPDPGRPRAPAPGASTSRPPAPDSSTPSPPARSSSSRAPTGGSSWSGADLMSAIIDPPGPDDRRAVRRRRGRGAARGGGAGIRHPRLLPPRRWQRAGGSPDARRRKSPPGERGDRGAAGAFPPAERAGGVQVRRVADGGVRANAARGATGSAPRMWRWWCRTRPTSASSTPRRSGWACPPSGWRRCWPATATPPRRRCRWRWRTWWSRGGSSGATCVVLVAVGAGFTAGATLMRWA